MVSFPPAHCLFILQGGIVYHIFGQFQLGGGLFYRILSGEALSHQGSDQGSGIGFAPIGHTVTVSGVTGRTINVKFKLTLENNVSWPDVQAAVTAAIRGYFQSLIRLWADSEAITVRISQIETRVLAVPGVLDVENTTLNAVGANIQLTGTEIPVLGEVSNGTA